MGARGAILGWWRGLPMWLTGGLTWMLRAMVAIAVVHLPVYWIFDAVFGMFALDTGATPAFALLTGLCFLMTTTSLVAMLVWVVAGVYAMARMVRTTLSQLRDSDSEVEELELEDDEGAFGEGALLAFAGVIGVIALMVVCPGPVAVLPGLFGSETALIQVEAVFAGEWIDLAVLGEFSRAILMALR